MKKIKKKRTKTVYHKPVGKHRKKIREEQEKARKLKHEKKFSPERLAKRATASATKTAERKTKAYIMHVKRDEHYQKVKKEKAKGVEK